MLVLGNVHVGAQLVGGGPQRFFDVFDHMGYKTWFTITKNPVNITLTGFEFGGTCGGRTHDKRIKSPLLYQLS